MAGILDRFKEEIKEAVAIDVSRKVKVVNGKDSGGILQIEFYSEEDLSELAAYFDR